MGVIQRIGRFRCEHNYLFGLFVFIAIVLIINAALLPFVDVIPPKPRTILAIQMARRSIQDFIKMHGARADQPNDMIKSDHDVSAAKDAWGHLLVVRVNADGTISVISYGKDGIPGGQGEDADIVGTFDPKTTNGAWIRDPINR